MTGPEGAPTPPAVPLGGPLAEARFVERPNRFLVRCRLRDAPADTLPAGVGAGNGGPAEEEGREGPLVEAHLPDPGRLRELLVPGRRLRLRHEPSPRRKTDWTAALVETPSGGAWVSLDTTLPNRLVEAGLRSGYLEEFAGWRLEGWEVTVGASRLDFLLSRGDGRRLALEVKSVTLVVDGEGRFPDAVTARGARHVRELAEVARRDGWEAAVLFVAQRLDVERVVADPEIDPEFASALEAARAAGVRALARRCRVTPARVELGGRVPVG